MLLHDMAMPEIDDHVIFDRGGPRGRILPGATFLNVIIHLA